MRELVYYVAVSLDGCIAAPDGNADAFPVEGDHMPALLSRFADAVPAHVATALDIQQDLSTFDTVLMGRTTYAVAADQGIASPYPHLRQYVFSRSEHPPVDGVTITSEDPAAVVRRLKAETSGSAIWLCGGGSLAASLVDEIDRLVLKVNPVVLGAGIPLFAAGPGYRPRPYALERSTAYESGVVVDEYRTLAGG